MCRSPFIKKSTKVSKVVKNAPLFIGENQLQPKSGSQKQERCEERADDIQDQFWFTMYSAGKGWTLDSFGRRPMDEREA